MTVACLIWAEHTFNCGIPVLSKALKMSDNITRTGRPNTSTIVKAFRIKKMILDNRHYKRDWHIIWFMPRNFYWCFRHETWGSKDCSKFWAKNKYRIEIAQELLNIVNDVPDYFTGRRRNISAWLWHWNKKVRAKVKILLILSLLF